MSANRNTLYTDSPYSMEAYEQNYCAYGQTDLFSLSTYATKMPEMQRPS